MVGVLEAVPWAWI